MGELLTFKPDLHFPFREPFQIKDQHNGEQRGTWFFRSVFPDKIHGPFHSREEAETMVWIEDHPEPPLFQA